MKDTYIISVQPDKPAISLTKTSCGACMHVDVSYNRQVVQVISKVHMFSDLSTVTFFQVRKVNTF